jgi:hypothetical protein
MGYECNTNVTTLDESVCRSELMQVQEWPLGWPNSTPPSPDELSEGSLFVVRTQILIPLPSVGLGAGG